MLDGEKPVVATAIREHYLPNSSEGELPQTKVGAVLALADKLDTILSFFTVGLIPSGSNDPYALRRATQGVVRILEQFGWHIALDQLLDELFELHFESLDYANKSDVIAFFKARVEKMMNQSISKDIKQAILDSSTFIVSELIENANILFKRSKTNDFKEAVESLTRVFNLTEKANANEVVKEELFENEYEKELYRAISDLQFSSDSEDNLDKLFNLKSVIDNFFDNTMVMSNDDKVKNNRLALLKSLTVKASQFAKFNEINTK